MSNSKHGAGHILSLKSQKAVCGPQFKNLQHLFIEKLYFLSYYNHFMLQYSQLFEFIIIFSIIWMISKVMAGRMEYAGRQFDMPALKVPKRYNKRRLIGSFV